MKVLYLINFAGKAGTEKYVENLVRLLGDRGLVEPYFAYCVPGDLSDKMAAWKVPCLRLDLSWKNARKAAATLGKYCLEHGIEVIHAQYPRENIIALMARKYCPVKVVFTSHLTLRLSGLSGIGWRFLNRRFTPKNHRIISVCSPGKDILIENGVAPEKIQVIYNGIEASPLTPGKPEKLAELGISEDCFVISILARLSSEKGLDFLLDCLSELKKRTDRQFCCLICGDGELKVQLESKRRALGLENECRLLGFRRDVGDILACSHVYVCTSSCNEAMSFAVLEAMEKALPLVVTDVGGNRDLAETDFRCGYVLPYGDVSGFTDKLQLLMEDARLREELSSAAREKVEKRFDLNRLVLDVYNAYL